MSIKKSSKRGSMHLMCGIELVSSLPSPLFLHIFPPNRNTAHICKTEYVKHNLISILLKFSHMLTLKLLTNRPYPNLTVTDTKICKTVRSGREKVLLGVWGWFSKVGSDMVVFSFCFVGTTSTSTNTNSTVK